MWGYHTLNKCCPCMDNFCLHRLLNAWCASSLALILPGGGERPLYRPLLFLTCHAHIPLPDAAAHLFLCSKGPRLSTRQVLGQFFSSLVLAGIDSSTSLHWLFCLFCVSVGMIVTFFQFALRPGGAPLLFCGLYPRAPFLSVVFALFVLL
jgi:hypothetical protein